MAVLGLQGVRGGVGTTTITAARAAYQNVLTREPTNADAILGLTEVDIAAVTQRRHVASWRNCPLPITPR